jgi:hypothetical protein
MENMKLAHAIEISYQETKEIMIEAGLVIGETLHEAEINATSTVIAWDVKVKSSAGSMNETYLTYNLISVDQLAGADNKVKMRMVYVALDIFTRKNKGSKQITELIQKLEDASLEKGWQFELADVTDYDMESKLYHLSFELTKKLI